METPISTQKGPSQTDAIKVRDEDASSWKLCSQKRDSARGAVTSSNKLRPSVRHLLSHIFFLNCGRGFLILVLRRYYILQQATFKYLDYPSSKSQAEPLIKKDAKIRIRKGKAMLNERSQLQLVTFDMHYNIVPHNNIMLQFHSKHNRWNSARGVIDLTF